MNIDPSVPPDAELSRLLREARSSPALPPRFQEAVWQRLASPPARPWAEAWLSPLLDRLLEPRWAVTAATALLLAGALLGTWEGKQQVQHAAQARYLANFMLGARTP
jgi:hypothetical protein